LALALGRTRRELLRSIDAHELQEWQCYGQLEPWGGELEDAHFASLEGLLLNRFRGKGGAGIDAQRLRLWMREAPTPAGVYQKIKGFFGL